MDDLPFAIFGGLFVLGYAVIPALLRASAAPFGLPAPFWLGVLMFLLVLFFLFGLG